MPLLRESAPEAGRRTWRLHLVLPEGQRLFDRERQQEVPESAVAAVVVPALPRGFLVVTQVGSTPGRRYRRRDTLEDAEAYVKHWLRRRFKILTD